MAAAFNNLWSRLMMKAGIPYYLLWVVWLHLVVSQTITGARHLKQSPWSRILLNPGWHGTADTVDKYRSNFFLKLYSKHTVVLRKNIGNLVKHTDGTTSKAIISQCSQSSNTNVRCNTCSCSTIRCSKTYRRREVWNLILQNLPYINDNVSLSS